MRPNLVFDANEYWLPLVGGAAIYIVERAAKFSF